MDASGVPATQSSKSWDEIHKRHYSDSSRHNEWDYLKGEGPSSSLYYGIEEKKGFKPGWKSLRSQNVIQQDKERIQNQENLEGKKQQMQELRTQRLQEWNQYNNYNPISGQAKAQSGVWEEASNPWQHQKLGLKSQSAIKSESVKPINDCSSNTAAMSRVQQRKNVLANDGVSTAQRTKGTVKDALTWQ